jgi:formyl-CoA transferase
MAEWMTIPLLNQEFGNPFKRVGLAHPTIVPYGVFKTRDGADVLISIQNDREWVILARDVMDDAALAADPDFATVVERVKRRSETDGRVAKSFGSMSVDELTQKLAKADIAFGRVNDPESLRHHPHLRRITIGSPTGPVSYPAPAALRPGEPRQYGAIPALGEHSEKIRKEFGT